MRAITMITGGLWRRAGKLPIPLILGVAVLAGGGGFAATKIINKPPADAEKAKDGETGSEEDGSEAQNEKLGPAETVDLGEFLVNISDGAGEMRYVKTNMSLIVQLIEHEEDKSGGGGGHGGEHGSAGGKDDAPQLPPDEHRIAQDAVVSVLASEKFDKLQADDGREKLKSALLTKLDERLETYKVTEVLLTSFVMQ